MGFERVEMNEAGIGEMLRSPGVLADLRRRADRIAAAGGPGMEASSMVGHTRARASVITATPDARRAEATRRALTAAVDAGRG